MLIAFDLFREEGLIEAVRESDPGAAFRFPCQLPNEAMDLMTSEGENCFREFLRGSIQYITEALGESVPFCAFVVPFDMSYRPRAKIMRIAREMGVKDTRVYFAPDCMAILNHRSTDIEKALHIRAVDDRIEFSVVNHEDTVVETLAVSGVRPLPYEAEEEFLKRAMFELKELFFRAGVLSNDIDQVYCSGTLPDAFVHTLRDRLGRSFKTEPGEPVSGAVRYLKVPAHFSDNPVFLPTAASTISVASAENGPVVERDSTIPILIQQSIRLAHDSKVRVYEGESDDHTLNTQLAEYDLSPIKPGTNISCELRIGRRGIIRLIVVGKHDQQLLDVFI